MRFELGLGPVRIGRGSACQLVLADPTVSREHAEIQYRSDGFVIADLGSSFGTFVDDQQVEQARLKDGSRIRLGTCEFIFRFGQDSIPTVMAADDAPASGAPSAPARAPGPDAPLRPPAIPSTGPSAPAPLPVSAATHKNARRSKVLVACGVVALLVICGCLMALAVGMVAGVSDGPAAGINRLLGGAASAFASEDLELALAVPLPDERPAILENLGRPDEFDISIVQVEGGQVRLESWRYYGLGTRVDFADGAVVWTIDLEPAAEGTFFPAWYDPTQFETDMTIEEATSQLTSASPAGTFPEKIDLSAGGEELAGTVLVVGDQITVGFQDGRLVYVETLGVTMQEGGA
jgi:hypothetical protein